MKEKWIKIFDYICEFSLYGLILSIPISKAAIEIFFAFAFTGFLFKKILKPDFKFLRSPIYLFLLLFISFSALSLINSGPYLVKGLRSLIGKWIEYVLIFIIVADTLTTRKRIRNVLLIILSAGLLIGIDGLSQYLFTLEFIRHRSWGGVANNISAISASFNYSTDFGGYLLIVLSLALALFISKQRKLYKITLFLLAVLLEACLLLSFSRGAWIGFIFAFFLMLFISRKFKELIPVFAIFIILLITMPITRQRLAFIFKVGSDMGRFGLWHLTFSMIKENPLLGKGIGTFMDYFSKRMPNAFIQYAHNCFLQIWVETGVFSLLSFLAFIASLLSRGIVAFKKKNNNNYMLLGMVCGIFGFLVHSFFDTHFYSLQLSALFWSMAGILFATIKLEANVSK